MKVIALAIAAFGISGVFAQGGAPGQWGRVDWVRRVVVATGIGAPPADVPLAAARPNALRAARMIALRNALEVVKGIPVVGVAAVGDQGQDDGAIATRIDGFIRGFEQQGRTRYMSDGSVEITLEIALDGGLADIMLPPELIDTPLVGISPKDARKAPAFTGLIVDCSGMGITPSLTPAVLDESGEVVVGVSHLSRTWARKWGCAGYSHAVDSARVDAQRVGSKPLIIRAVGGAGQFKTDAVIAKKDAALIKSNGANLRILQECRIVFVIDPP